MNANMIDKLGALKKLAGVKFEASKPEIFLGVGFALIGIGIFEACKSTLVVDEEIAPIIEDIEDLKEDRLCDLVPDDEYRKEIVKVYANLVKTVGKDYALAFILIITGFGSILYSYGVMKGRNLMLMAAAKMWEDSYNGLRGEIKDRYGEEVENELVYGIHKEKSVESAYLDADGNEKTKKVKNANVSNPYSQHSPYSRFFDETSDAWSPSAEYNKTYILAQEKNANDKLRIRGWITLAEVYEMLGFEATEASLAVGWVLGNGDNEVRFNIFDVQNEATRRFVNGYEPSILLDFNVDGVILEKLRDIGLAKI